MPTKKRRIFINGAEWLSCPNTNMDLSNDGYASFDNVTQGTVAYVDPSTYPMADFDASGYAAQLTSNDKAVIVGGTKLTSNATDLALNHTLTLFKEMTVAELTTALTASTGATVKVFNGNVEVTNDATAVTEDFAVQVTSPNGRVIVKYNVILEEPVENWTEALLTQEVKTGGFTPSGKDNTRIAVFEWYFDFPDAVDPNSASPTRYGLRESNANRIEVATSSLGFTTYDNVRPTELSNATTRIETLGGQRIHVIELLNMPTKTRRIFINGAEWLSCPNTNMDLSNSGYASFDNVTQGTVAYINPIQYPMANFNASGYAAQLTSSDSAVIVGGTKLTSNATDFALNHTVSLTKATMTVAELKAALTASTGATVKVFNGNVEVTNDATAVTEDFAVQVTSQNGRVIVKYNVVFDLPVENWTESVLTPEVKTGSFTPSGKDTSRVAVFEWYYDSPEIVDEETGEVKDYGLYEGYYNRMEVGTSNLGLTALGYRPGRYDDNTPSIYDTEITSHSLIETDSGQRIHVLELLDLTTGKRRVFINGVEFSNCSTTRMYIEGSASFRNVTEGTVAYINATKYPMVNFNASGYAAQLTSNDAGVIVGGTKLQDTGTEFALNHTLTLTKAMTAKELKAALTASTGAEITVLDTTGTAVVDDATAVTEGFAVQVTSSNEQVIVKYNVAFGYPMFAINGENLEVSVIAESSNDLLYLAAYSEGGTKLDKVALGTLSDGKLVATLKLSEISGKIVKAFHWSNTLQPIEMKEYIPE